VAVLLLLDKRFRFRRGRLFWLYVAVYTLGRVWIEMLRIDEAEMVSLFGVTARLNVWTSVLLFIAAVVIFALLGRRERTVADESLYLEDREPAAPATAAAAGTAAGKDVPAEARPAGGAVNNSEISGKNPAANGSTETGHANLAGTSPEADHAPGSGGSDGRSQRDRSGRKDARKK
jgi:hypothetical protein